jgi:hypothetical protein
MSNEETLETTLGDLIVALTEEAESCSHIKPRDLHILVAYILSDLFGSAPVSRSWH